MATMIRYLLSLSVTAPNVPQCFSSTSFLMSVIDVQSGNIGQCQSGQKMAGFRKTVNRKINRWHVYIYAVIFSVTILCLLYAFRSVNRIAITFRTVQNNNNYLTPKFSSDFQGVSVVIILCNDGRRKLSAAPSLQNGTSAIPDTRRVRRDGSSRIARDFDRQINQTVVLLKSIAIQQSLSKLENQINILVLSDKNENFRRLEEVVGKERWSVDYMKYLKLTFVPVSYPPGSLWMRRLFRPCATLRLFLAELLPSVDSVIYLDTDLIFLRPVTELWAKFNMFSEVNLAAMAPCLNHYGSAANSVPFYGKTGLNAGVMLMNLTRIRASDWSVRLTEITEMYHDKIKLADQDILNIYFNSNPSELYELSCDWNFRPFQCRRGSFCLDFELAEGISALHGNALSFTNMGPEPVFHSVFTTFENFSMSTASSSLTMKKLMVNLHKNVMRVQRRKKIKASCANYGAFPLLLLNRMNKLIQK